MILYKLCLEGCQYKFTIFHGIWFFQTQPLKPCDGKGVLICIYLKKKPKKENSSSHCWREIKKNVASVNSKCSETRIKSTKKIFPDNTFGS